MDAVQSNLSAAAGETFMGFEEQLWMAVDEEIRLAECDIYRCVYIIIVLCRLVVRLQSVQRFSGSLQNKKQREKRRKSRMRVICH